MKFVTCLFALLFVGAFAHDFTQCGSTDHLKLSAVTLTPDSPNPGKNLEVALTGHADEAIQSGTATLTVKVFGVTIDTIKFDMCTQLGLTCPVTGAFAASINYLIPSVAPAGITADCNIEITDASGNELDCIDLKATLAKAASSSAPGLVTKKPHTMVGSLVDDSNLLISDVSVIDAVNKDASSTWKAGVNERFVGFTVGDMRNLMGAISDPRNDLPKIQHSAEVLAATPASYDPRQSRSMCTGPVLDQGFCGSCWAFGATTAISDRLCMASPNKTFVQLAPLDLTTCDDGFLSFENGCQGGQLQGAWDYAKSTGLVDEECYPYLKSQGGPVPTCDPTAQPCLPESKFIQTPKCTKTCANGADWESSKHKLSSVYSVSVDQLKAELYTNGPVESAFTVYADFPNYKTGVYSHTTGSALGGHAIKVIGYGSEDGTDYWWVQNSWTTTWGDGGYFKIKAGDNECGIENQLIAGSF